MNYAHLVAAATAKHTKKVEPPDQSLLLGEAGTPVPAQMHNERAASAARSRTLDSVGRAWMFGGLFALGDLCAGDAATVDETSTPVS